MIFICLGTKRFSLNRLLKELDELVEKGKIKNNIFAQIGHSTYIPRNYKYKRFMDPQEYERAVENASLVITHGGTGAIIKALKADKQIIAIPRLEKFSEHSDDHQLQIVDVFERNGYVAKVEKMGCLEQTIKELQIKPITKKFNGKGEIVEIIDGFIMEPFNN